MERGIISCKTEATKNILVPPFLFSHLINGLSKQGVKLEGPGKRVWYKKRRQNM